MEQPAERCRVNLRVRESFGKARQQLSYVSALEFIDYVSMCEFIEPNANFGDDAKMRGSVDFALQNVMNHKITETQGFG